MRIGGKPAAMGHIGRLSCCSGWNILYVQLCTDEIVRTVGELKMRQGLRKQGII
jgi:hypothetical protein